MDTKIKHIQEIISDLHREIIETENRLKVLNNDLNCMNNMAKRYGTQENLNLNFVPTSLVQFRFKGVNLRDTILTILKEHEGQLVKAREILKMALEGGYETTSNNFESAIYGMIGRLVKGNQILKTGPGIYTYPKDGVFPS